MAETESLILHMLRDIRENMATKKELADLRTELRGEIAEVRSELADVRSEVHSLRADVASDLITLEKRLGDQIGVLRRSVMEYHSTVIGHGVLYGELEERVGRIERHLQLGPAEKH